MRAPSLAVESVAKRYRIGLQPLPRHTLREVITAAAAAPLRRLYRRHDFPAGECLWALKDVSFDVHAGEALGIVGRNGAGKSTLLKILSRITRPTLGQIRVWGRVASLLEVGTGFHLELTGRENIFLNGAILGMTRREMNRKLDAIVDFSGVERFLDTPVKRYSSGMQMRLAFAVAAHLEPDILVVDEILAVGDAAFQRKCLSKMEDVGRSGRTVIFVSHDLAAVTRLCSRAVLLEQGRLVMDGAPHAVVRRYLDSGTGTTARRVWPDLETAPGNEVVRMLCARVVSEDGATRDSTDITQPIGVELTYYVQQPGHVLAPSCHFFNEDGICLFISNDTWPEWRRAPRPIGRYTSTVWIPGNFFSEGRLTVHCAIATLDPINVHCFERDVVSFQVVDSLNSDSARGDYAGSYGGVVRPLLRWTTGLDTNDDGTAEAKK